MSSGDEAIFYDVQILYDVAQSRSNKNYKRRIDPFEEYDDVIFFRHYRIKDLKRTLQGTSYIVDLVKTDISSSSNRGGALSPELIVLRYLAAGSYQKDVGFLQCVGAVNGTHTKIKNPGQEFGARHRYRKKIEEAPLVIALKDGGKTSSALQSLRIRQATLYNEEIVIEKNKTTNDMLPETYKGSDDIEKRAARELLAEIGKEGEQESVESNIVLPLKPEDIPLDGAKEPTLDDYESIPITQFGKAMLRGMGWKEDPKTKSNQIEGPILRPKGMGLGADKALKPKALIVPPEANEILEIKKGACVRVLGGKNKDLYGQIEGLDDHAGRVIVKMALSNCKESFNEFMVQPVSKKEYSEYSKCINSSKYDEYKKMENKYGQIMPKVIKEEQNENASEEILYSRSQSTHAIQEKREKHLSPGTGRRSRSRDRRDEELAPRSTGERRHRHKNKQRRKSNESFSSSSSASSFHRHERKKTSKKSKKSKGKKHVKRYSSSSSNDERQRKTKSKKSKRKRSRSRSKCRR